MKKTKLWIAICVFAVASGCSKEIPELLNEPIVIDEPINEPIDEPVDTIMQVEDSINAKRIIGSWVVTNPELTYGRIDTIVFTGDYRVEKHFFFNGWKYYVSDNRIEFYNDEKGSRIWYPYLIENSNKMILYRFIHGATSSYDIDIPFTKISDDL
ncbi:MAG TPA: hypothetical protein VLZ75_10485 [Chitinophagales bacterium]|nr:hypothetical protein [Chitinophagales bacterium]